MKETWRMSLNTLVDIWNTGEGAKTYVLNRILECLTLSEFKSTFAELWVECIKEAETKIEKGDFEKPIDWGYSIIDLSSACKIFDRAGIMKDTNKRSAFKQALTMSMQAETIQDMHKTELQQKTKVDSKITVYEMVIRHEPQTNIESEEGWWYERYQFEKEDEQLAVKKSQELCDEICKQCAQCIHSVDELYRLEDEERISIYNDGVYQTVSWDKNDNEHKIKRVTEGTFVNFLRTRL